MPQWLTLAVAAIERGGDRRAEQPAVLHRDAWPQGVFWRAVRHQQHVQAALAADERHGGDRQGQWSG